MGFAGDFNPDLELEALDTLGYFEQLLASSVLASWLLSDTKNVSNFLEFPKEFKAQLSWRRMVKYFSYILNPPNYLQSTTFYSLCLYFHFTLGPN